MADLTRVMMGWSADARLDVERPCAGEKLILPDLMMEEEWEEELYSLDRLGNLSWKFASDPGLPSVIKKTVID